MFFGSRKTPIEKIAFKKDMLLILFMMTLFIIFLRQSETILRRTGVEASLMDFKEDFLYKLVFVL